MLYSPKRGCHCLLTVSGGDKGPRLESPWRAGMTTLRTRTYRSWYGQATWQPTCDHKRVQASTRMEIGSRRTRVAPAVGTNRVKSQVWSYRPAKVSSSRAPCPRRSRSVSSGTRAFGEYSIGSSPKIEIVVNGRSVLFLVTVFTADHSLERASGHMQQVVRVARLARPRSG